MLMCASALISRCSHTLRGKANVVPISPSPLLNRILAALPLCDQDALFPSLECVTLPAGWVVCESGSDFDGLYFPTTGIVSLLHVMENGSAAETAVIGNDGMVGISLFMGGESTTSRAVVQHAGHAYRLKARALRAEFALGGRLQYLALRYAQSLLTQMSQTTVCNRHHRLDQQLCRWLLLRLDLLADEAVLMTQEQIANTLGVRREAVTEAAGRLQHEGLISYSRGRISLLDRAGLERRVCECYGVVKQECQRLLPA